MLLEILLIHFACLVVMLRSCETHVLYIYKRANRWHEQSQNMVWIVTNMRSGQDHRLVGSQISIQHWWLKKRLLDQRLGLFSGKPNASTGNIGYLAVMLILWLQSLLSHDLKTESHHLFQVGSSESPMLDRRDKYQSEKSGKETLQSSPSKKEVIVHCNC